MGVRGAALRRDASRRCRLRAAALVGMRTRMSEFVSAATSPVRQCAFRRPSRGSFICLYETHAAAQGCAGASSLRSAARAVLVTRLGISV